MPWAIIVFILIYKIRIVRIAEDPQRSITHFATDVDFLYVFNYLVDNYIEKASADAASLSDSYSHIYFFCYFIFRLYSSFVTTEYIYKIYADIFLPHDVFESNSVERLSKNYEVNKHRFFKLYGILYLLS